MSAESGNPALRFDWTGDGMQYHQYGQYVGHDDYAKLEQQRAALVEALKDAEARAIDWITHPETIEAKRQWDAVAEALGADKDCPDSVLIAAKARAVIPDGWVAIDPARVRLWDSQWSIIVNHAQCYEGWSKDDAIAHAVKLTEQAIERNVRSGVAPSARPDPKESSNVE